MAQDGDFFTFDFVNFNRAVPAFDGHLFGFQTGGCFIHEQAADFEASSRKRLVLMSFHASVQLVFDGGLTSTKYLILFSFPQTSGNHKKNRRIIPLFVSGATLHTLDMDQPKSFASG
ncbi:hypothetical protein ACULNC_04320 [Shigella flexneri]